MEFDPRIFLFVLFGHGASWDRRPPTVPAVQPPNAEAGAPCTRVGTAKTAPTRAKRIDAMIQSLR